MIVYMSGFNPVKLDYLINRQRLKYRQSDELRSKNQASATEHARLAGRSRTVEAGKRAPDVAAKIFRIYFINLYYKRPKRIVQYWHGSMVHRSDQRSKCQW